MQFPIKLKNTFFEDISILHGFFNSYLMKYTINIYFLLTGTLLQRQYNQFAGTVQVMKAVGDHLVLTFCQRLPESQLFSVILSREPQQLGRQVVHSIHNLLNRRDLSTSAVRKVCRSAAPSIDASVGSIAAFTLVSLFVYFGAGRI